MAIEYLGLSNINGPLVVLEGIQDAFYDEIVEFTVEGNTKIWDVLSSYTKTKQSFRYLKGQKICLSTIPIPN